ncbi:hypothetical protein HGG71_11585, partial [Rhodobacteraceae bacterium R_SAG2]|nr:hypothetical protein [Rhodobacteraceae bacterium R_SAG2]
LGGLANLGFNMGNTITDRQAADGAQARQLQQQIIDAAQGQWGGYTGSAATGLAGLQQGVASAPSGVGSTTESSNPGVMGILGAFL